MASYELYNFDKWERAMQKAVNDFDIKRKYLLQRLGRIYQAEVKKLTPVDTGRLRASISTQQIDDNTVMVGTNVIYARFIEEGFQQSPRFVPGRFRKSDGGFVYDPTAKGGIKLRGRFVNGRFMFKRALNTSEKLFEAEIKRFMQEIERNLTGGGS